MAVESSPPGFERVVIIHNHREKTAELAQRCQRELDGWFMNRQPVTTLRSAKGGREPNAELMQKELRAGDAVALVGGDGTFRDVAGALLLPEMETLAREVAVTSLNQGGNACDIGTALHGRRKWPRAILGMGRGLRAVTAYAMDCAVANEAGVTSHHAMSYIGMGKSAEAAAIINTDRYKNGKRVLRDIGVVLGTLTSGFSFTILDQDGESRCLSDITFAKGSRMAKQFRFPIHHWEEAIRATPVAEGRPSTAYAATGLLFGQAAGLTDRGPFQFTTLSPVSMHFDGEPPIEIPPQSQVAVGLAPQTYTLLTTHLS